MKTSNTRLFRRISARRIARSWFGIPNHIVAQYFQDYFLHYYSGKQVIELTSEGKFAGDYTVYYHNTTRGEILANPKERFACSFRIPKEELNLPAYVMIGRGEL